MLRTFFLLIFLTVLVLNSESLKCYKCEPDDVGCYSDFNKDVVKVVSCPKGRSCRKIKHFSIGPITEPITRDCSDGRECDDLNVCFECDEDLCNSANYYAKPLLIVIVSCVLHYLLE